MPKVENKHRVISNAQEKGRMDAEGMKSGVLHELGLGRRRSLLVYAFEARVTESMIAAFTEKTPILGVILGGLTSVLPEEMIESYFVKYGVVKKP